MSQFGQYPGDRPPTQQPVAGSGVEQEKASPELVMILSTAVQNFRQLPITIVSGVTFNQYTLLETEHAYLNSQFQSGSLDENGDERYFHNIITPRNSHATKNIDLDTKDVLITADSPDGWWFSFLLRNKITQWMRDHNFGQLLNDLATNLPNFGKVIWKKCGEGVDTYIEEVDMRSVVFDPSVKNIKDSELFLERSVMSPRKIMGKVKAGGWDKNAALRAIAGAQTKKDNFIGASGAPSSAVSQYSVTDTIPNLDVWEIHGWLPKASVVEYLETEADDEGESDTTEDGIVEEEFCYVKLIVANLEAGTTEVLYADEIDEDEFPYQEFNFFRRVPGRCLPQSNTEVLISLQVRMNELVGRFFKAIRMGSLHLFQTKKGSAYKNLMQDAQDGDIIESKEAIVPIATEIRAFNEYQTEFNNIENQADKLCNTYDVVTGDNSPTNTPFRLAVQQSQNANKIFDQVREDVGLALTEVFERWILPEIIDDLSLESILEVTGSVEEMKMFDEQYRKIVTAQSVKEYVLKNNYLPTEEEFKTLQDALAEQSKGKTKKVKVESKYFTMDTIKSFRIFFDITDERKNFTAQRDSMSTMLQIIASNPAVLESEESRVLMGKILESLNISPVILTSLVSKPTPKQMPGGPQSPAAQGGAGNPADAAAAAAQGQAQPA